MINIACIGSGNMGAALMKGALAGNAGGNFKIYFTDADAQKAQDVAASIKANFLKTNAEAADVADFVFLAVKPQILQSVLEEITLVSQKRFGLNNPPVFVSMAAGWSIEKIQSALRVKVPVIRMMPNTPALIGKGMIAYAASPEITAAQLDALEKILCGAGVTDKIEEKYLNAVTGLSGSGPAFVYLFIESLAEGGARAGLAKDKALGYAAQTALGAAGMVQETGKLPQELIDMVTSPGGATLAGLSALKENAFSEAVIKAVEAAKKRAEELG